MTEKQSSTEAVAALKMALIKIVEAKGFLKDATDLRPDGEVLTSLNQMAEELRELGVRAIVVMDRTD